MPHERTLPPYRNVWITLCGTLLLLWGSFTAAADDEKATALTPWRSPLPSLADISLPFETLATLGQRRIVVIHGNTPATPDATSSPATTANALPPLYALPEDDIRLTYAFTVIDAPEKNVRQVLMNFGRYRQTMPHITESRVLAHNDNHWLGQYRLIFQMPMLTFEPLVTIQHSLLENGDLIERRVEGDIDYSTTRWQIISLNPKQTLLVQTSWADIGSVSWLMRLVFSAQPDLHRLSPLTAAALTLQSLKATIEKKPFSYRGTVPIMDTLSPSHLPYLPTLTAKQQQVLANLTALGIVNIISPVRHFSRNRRTFSLQPIISATALPQPFSALKSTATDITAYPDLMDVISDISDIVDNGEQHKSHWGLGFDFSVFRFTLNFDIRGQWKKNQTQLTFVSDTGDFNPLVGNIQWHDVPSGTLATISLAHNIKEDPGFILGAIKNIPYSQLFAGIYVGTLLTEGQQQLTH